MPAEAKKRKNSNFVNSNNVQRRITRSSTKANSEKKEERGEKRINSTEKQIKRTENQFNTSTFIKPTFRNSVFNRINKSLGFTDVSSTSKFQKEVILNQIERFQLCKLLMPFDRRVTAISWHPKYPQLFFAGSKGGDLVLHNANDDSTYFNQGVGAGGSILGLKCSYEDPYTVFTASLTGKLCKANFQEVKSVVLYSTLLNWDNWFTSLDMCRNRKFLLTGDCRGNAYLLSTSGEPIWEKKKLHSSKLTHCEFNVHNPDIFVTSSNDHTVKLWDMRTVSSSTGRNIQPLAEFPHVKAVNSAFFSPSNGVNILTTDQHSELRVYSGPLWDKMIKIIHPHRQFQHMTYIKAVWHPLEDIIIVGRYPDDNIQTNDPRTIDFYDGSNGELLHNTLSPTNNIVSLNAMNITGESLASAAGNNLTFLKDERLLEGYPGDMESDRDTEEEAAVNFNKNKGKKNGAKDLKKSCPKKSVPSKKQ